MRNSRLVLLMIVVFIFGMAHILSCHSDDDSDTDEVFECSDYNPGRTVGLIKCQPGAFEGYTLFAPLESTNTYLIDMYGRLVHSWESDFTPALSAYLLENGNLLRAASLGSQGNPFFQGVHGQGGRVQIFEWDGTIVWDYMYSSERHLQNHDIEILPNGNILINAWERKTFEQAVAAGRDPNLLVDGELWPHHIIEVAPIGQTGGIIVWEWHVWDHLVQDYDPAKDNFGVVEDHPELVHINYAKNPIADWNHDNAIDYNKEFDQIIVSVSYFNEIWVIDHSTTTSEAAGHGGGKSGKGGDILYRWGNPRAYRAGDASDQKLFFQHDSQWIESGLPGEGNILIFNNGLDRPGDDYSSVDEIIPPVDGLGRYSLTVGAAFGPDEAAWIYKKDNPADFYSDYISGAHRLANGNTLICSGAKGLIFEVTAGKEVVWEYVNPVADQGPVVQGEAIPIDPDEGCWMNHVFRAYRYAPDYPGLAGKDLTPGDFIELPDH